MRVNAGDFIKIYDSVKVENEPWYITHCGWRQDGVYLTSPTFMEN